MKILFVCLGNIIRSPLAEEILRQLNRSNPLPYSFEVKSCGLGDWHDGQLPDKRMRTVAKERGYVLKSRAQAFHPEFFDEFDMVFAADHAVLEELKSRTDSQEPLQKLYLMTEFSKAHQGQDVPDPYYYDRVTFERAYDMIENSCIGIMSYLREK